jgi:REP element-mobilizing transposase RayT
VGTDTFSAEWAESFCNFLLLPSPALAGDRRKLSNLRISFGARAAALQAHVYGYVVMPEHVHLLLSEPQLGTSPLKPTPGLNGPPMVHSDALKSLKQGIARRLIGHAEHFWQKRYYDFNIRDYPQFVEKLRYVHRNPVKAGLCEHPEEWEWSSFRHYATGFVGRVEIESQWTARKRERIAGELGAVVELPHSSQRRA